MGGGGACGLAGAHAAGLDAERGERLAVRGDAAAGDEEVGVVRRDEGAVGDIGGLLERDAGLTGAFARVDVDGMGAAGDAVRVAEGRDVFLGRHGMDAEDAAGLTDAGLGRG